MTNTYNDFVYQYRTITLGRVLILVLLILLFLAHVFGKDSRLESRASDSPNSLFPVPILEDR